MDVYDAYDIVRPLSSPSSEELRERAYVSVLSGIKELYGCTVLPDDFELAVETLDQIVRIQLIVKIGIKK